MSTESAESIFRGIVARAISRFVLDDSLKNVNNFICYLDLETQQSVYEKRRAGELGISQDIDELAKEFKTHLRVVCISEGTSSSSAVD